MAAPISSTEDLVTATSYLTGGKLCDYLDDSGWLFLVISGTDAQKSEVEKALKVIQGVAKKSGLEPDCIEVLMDYVLRKEGVSEEVGVA